MSGRFRIEALAPEHDREGFTCGSDPLDKYLREQASQDMRRRTSVCYVAIDEKTNAMILLPTGAGGLIRRLAKPLTTWLYTRP